ncbi:tubulin binding cofactor C-domain-containing protein [Lentinula aciculospora]|uniref:Tubulin binding cofactor C-domain-containing protein n=1 Tax=Lentinula aciculospora TaxID=153920 RepID=A0A9W9DWS5_9AGAR|nr:tubulin binding cofactor C-domain-containing protein [Lentinula aciculospora]
MAEAQILEGSRWNFSQNFLNDFQYTHSDLQMHIQQATQSGSISKQALDSLNLQLAELSKSIVDAAGFIPKYDQRKCENQLKEIEQNLERLRKTSTPVSRFAFKRKTKEARQSSFSVFTPSVTQSLAPTPSLALSSYTIKLITPKDLPDPESIAPELRSELSINDLDSCILNLLDAKQYEISALHIHNIKNSILLLPVLEGSAILHDLVNCVVVVRCHQFRMHSSQDIDVYLSIQSNPIIEHCSSIRFAPYPSTFPPTNLQHNSDFPVQDFSHIKSTPSPNWSVLVEGASKSFEDWQSILTIDASDVEQVLRKALPRV